MQYKIDFTELNWERPIEGVVHKLVVQDGRKLRLVEYSKSMPQHWCNKGHLGYILDGEMEIEFESETTKYKKGDGVFIPDGEKHKHRGRAISDKVLVIFVENA